MAIPVLLCFMAVYITADYSQIVHDALCATIFGIASMIGKLKVSTRAILLAGSVIQFLSMNSNIYYDHMGDMHTQSLHWIAYAIYYMFTPSVILINVALIFDTLRVIKSGYRIEACNTNDDNWFFNS